MSELSLLQVGLSAYQQIRKEADRWINPTHPAESLSPRSFSMRQFINSLHDLPAQTAALGMCEDRLPVLFDLTDPRPGALAVLGDEGSGKTRLLKVLLQTVMEINGVDDAKYVLVSNRLDEWRGQIAQGKRSGHCLAALRSEDSQVDEWIIRLAEIAEQRFSGRQNGAALLLVVDDMTSIALADFDARTNFDWLCRNGPSSQVFPVVSVNTKVALSNARWMAAFHTRLIGHMDNQAADHLGMYSGLDSLRLTAERQFAVRMQDQWMRFWLPTME